MHEVERMFFTGKKPWWYGNTYQGDAVGINLGAEAVTSRDAIRAADLDWTVLKEQAGYEQRDTGLWVKAPGEFFLLRDRDMSVLGRCAEKYVPYQNLDAFDFLDSLVKEGRMLYHTAGSLKGGARVWILGQLPGKMQIGRLSGKTNTHYPFMLVILGHDGVSAINLMATSIRAECANTCAFAEHRAEADKVHWSIVHTASAEAKLKIAAAALSEIPKAMVAEQELLQALASATMSESEFIEFATSIFLALDLEDHAQVEEAVAKWYEDATPRSKTIMENKVTEATKLFIAGQGNEGNSAYDALQAFTEMADHATIKEGIAANIDKAKRIARMQGIVHSAWLGAGGKRKDLVYKRLATWKAGR
ncbi:MAG: DUF932 domain-containing protein [Planctomycetota bacterium]